MLEFSTRVQPTQNVFCPKFDQDMGKDGFYLNPAVFLLICEDIDKKEG